MLIRSIGVLALIGVLLALPVSHSGVGDAPSASIVETTLSSWTPSEEGWLVAPALDAKKTVLVGATWRGDLAVEMRAHDSGSWGPWVALAAHDDHAPDGAHHHDDHYDDGHDHAHRHDDHADDAVHAADPIWIGRADRVQLRVASDSEAPEVRLETVEMRGGDGLEYLPSSPTSGQAIASPGDGEVIPRSAWDPNGDCQPSEPPEIAEDGFRMAHIHHTVMYPRYAPDEADDVVRALCLFHVELRGWTDLGYNFLVDRYGRIYEGREGSLHRPVVGAHAAGFNHASLGVVVVGDFETNPVPEGALDAIDRLLAWQFAHYGIHPVGEVEVVSSGGARPGLTAFEEDTSVVLPTIVGHRDTGKATLCPGRFLYAALGAMPARVAETMRAQGVEPDEIASVDPAPEPEVADDDPVQAAAASGVPDIENSAESGESSAAGSILPTSEELPSTGLEVASVALIWFVLAALLSEWRWRQRTVITSEEGQRRQRAR